MKQIRGRDYFAKTETSSDDILGSFSAAMKLLIHWPNEFEKYLREYHQRSSGEGVSGLSQQFRKIYIWLQKNSTLPDFRFAQDAFDNYLISEFDPFYNLRIIHRFNKNPALTSRLRFITTTEASEILKVAPRSLSQLAKAGHLTRYPSADERFALYDRQEVLALDAKWQSMLSLKEASVAIDTSRNVFRELVEVGLIRAESESSENDPKWRINERHLKVFLSRLAARTRILDVTKPEEYPDNYEGKFVDLTTAAKMMMPIGGNVAKVLGEVIAGRLPAYVESEPVLINRMMFVESLVQDCVESIQIRNNWISKSDTERVLKVKPPVLARWVESSLLAPIATVAHCIYFNREQVFRFYDVYVFSEEAAIMLGVGVLTVQKWVRNGRLRAVSGPQIDGNHNYLFRREEVKQIRSYLTASAVAEALGVTRTTLVARIQKGELRPVSGPGIDLSGHYLFEPQVTHSAIPLQKDNPEDTYE